MRLAAWHGRRRAVHRLDGDGVGAPPSRFRKPFRRRSEDRMRRVAWTQRATETAGGRSRTSPHGGDHARRLRPAGRASPSRIRIPTSWSRTRALAPPGGRLRRGRALPARTASGCDWDFGDRGDRERGRIGPAMRTRRPARSMVTLTVTELRAVMIRRRRKRSGSSRRTDRPSGRRAPPQPAADGKNEGPDGARCCLNNPGLARSAAARLLRRPGIERSGAAGQLSYSSGLRRPRSDRSGETGRRTRSTTPASTRVRLTVTDPGGKSDRTSSGGARARAPARQLPSERRHLRLQWAAPLTAQAITLGLELTGSRRHHRLHALGHGRRRGVRRRRRPASISVAFALPGSYQVRLRVTDNANAGGDGLRTTIASATAGRPRWFDYTPKFIAQGQAVEVHVGSSDPEGRMDNQEWDLDGDGAYDDATGAEGAGDVREHEGGVRRAAGGRRRRRQTPSGGCRIVPGNRAPPARIAVVAGPAAAGRRR